MGHTKYTWISASIWLFKKHYDHFSFKVANIEVLQSEQEFMQGSKCIRENTKAHY